MIFSNFNSVQFKTFFSKLSGRERILIVLAFIALLFISVDKFVFKKQRDEIVLREVRVNTERAILQRIQGEINAIDNGKFSDTSHQALETELHKLRDKAKTLDRLLANIKGTAPQLGELVRHLIRTQHQDISLLSLKTITPQLLLDQSVSKSGAIYRHGVEINIRGRYLDVLSYLRSLEATKYGLFWSGLNLSADGKVVSVRLKIFILSKEAKTTIT